MQNLKSLGYKMLDARGGLELDQLKLVLKELALFHALGAKIVTNQVIVHRLASS